MQKNLQKRRHPQKTFLSEMKPLAERVRLRRNAAAAAAAAAEDKHPADATPDDITQARVENWAPPRDRCRIRLDTRYQRTRAWWLRTGSNFSRAWSLGGKTAATRMCLRWLWAKNYTEYQERPRWRGLGDEGNNEDDWDAVSETNEADETSAALSRGRGSRRGRARGKARGRGADNGNRGRGASARGSGNFGSGRSTVGAGAARSTEGEAAATVVADSSTSDSSTSDSSSSSS